MSEITWYLSFSEWLISLTMMLCSMDALAMVLSHWHSLPCGTDPPSTSVEFLFESSAKSGLKLL